MVNLSHILINNVRPQNAEFSVQYLKAYFGSKYVDEVLKLLPQKPDPILIQQIFKEITIIGKIKYWFNGEGIDIMIDHLISKKHLEEFMKIDYTTVTETTGIKASQEQLAMLYHRDLEDLENLQLPPQSHVNGCFFDVCQNYLVRSKERDQLVMHLRKSGIEIMISWPKPLHKQESLDLGHLNLPMITGFE